MAGSEPEFRMLLMPEQKLAVTVCIWFLHCLHSSCQLCYQFDYTFTIVFVHSLLMLELKSKEQVMCRKISTKITF